MSVIVRATFRREIGLKSMSVPIVDALVVALAYSIYTLFHSISFEINFVFVGPVLLVAIAILMDSYNFELRFATFQQIGFIVILVTIWTVSLVFISLFMDDLIDVDYNFITLYVAILIGQLSTRAAYFHYLEKFKVKESVLVLGRNWLANELVLELKSRSGLGWSVIQQSGSGPELLNLDDIIVQKASVVVDALAQQISLKPGRQMQTCIDKTFFDIKYPGKKLFSGQDFFETISRRIPIPHDSNENDGAFLIARPTNRVFHGYGWHLFNVCTSLFVLLLTLPITIFIAIIIKIDDGDSVFFKQERIGLNMKKFVVFKFRTMRDSSVENQALSNQARITRAGRYLRRFHLDELPQFYNVLKRELNIVGPRPFIEDEVNEFKKSIPLFEQRYFVRPGITGMAQVLYKYSNTLKDARVKLGYDLFYVKNRGYGLDALIILWTIRKVIYGKSIS